ncbi:MAG: TIGR04283 family arsenosugar biosynthesis glycosyltransferase [Planctomycetota bacterium]|nr:TIGR04283 family arsenosugar biosynthesis glycosyltransferase [Planctomycetota bacterium]
MISVVIPVLDEEQILDDSLADLQRQEGAKELIVVDGGSGDRSVEMARRHARVIQMGRGRARQMNRGAREAAGDILLFLHADCRLEPGALGAVRAAIGRGASGGCFRQVIRAPGVLYRVIEKCADLRARNLAYFYGDSGLFLGRDLFFQLGGYPDVPIMEEVGLTRALKKAGPVHLLRKRIYVSPRRWQTKGVLRTTLRNWAITARYHLGTSPESLAREYHPVR